MPFGKYRGWSMETLPFDYLRWLVALPDLREPLRSEAAAEWRRRNHPAQPVYELDLIRVPAEDTGLFAVAGAAAETRLTMEQPVPVVACVVPGCWGLPVAEAAASDRAKVVARWHVPARGWPCACV
jgi:putative quorum-sensing-regulated virulence factor